ncbi:MAG: hypothetical protein H7274_24940 [Rhodoferax sp.]|nr:hypothetical protein [Rhodoferax sp.]
MDPLFLIILVALALVFVYSTRRAMRQTLKLPVPQDASANLKKAAAASRSGQVEAPVSQPARPGQALRAPQNMPAEDARPTGAARPVQAAQAKVEEAWGRNPKRPERHVAASARPRRYDSRSRRDPLPTAAVPGAYRASRGQKMYGSRASLNQAIISMTVLGPCRAIEPYVSGGAAEGLSTLQR